MNDVVDRELRDMARAFAETAPVSPEMPEASSPVGLRRSARVVGLVAVAAVLLAVVGVGTALVADSFRSNASVAAPVSVGPDGWIVIVFFEGGAPSDEAVAALEARAEVAELYVVDKPLAYEEGFEIFADDKAMLELLGENPGLLSARISVRTSSEADAASIIRFAERLDGFTHVLEDPFYGPVDSLPFSD